ncbi:hypothetical protein DFH06DRAFT_1127390 [Mycena polygramma]|nr:hypothetical protein DFH06DRAFT_1127390 [Mycena polygramma]
MTTSSSAAALRRVFPIRSGTEHERGTSSEEADAARRLEKDCSEEDDSCESEPDSVADSTEDALFANLRGSVNIGEREGHGGDLRRLSIHHDLTRPPLFLRVAEGGEGGGRRSAAPTKRFTVSRGHTTNDRDRPQRKGGQSQEVHKARKEECGARVRTWRLGRKKNGVRNEARDKLNGRTLNRCYKKAPVRDLIGGSRDYYAPPGTEDHLPENNFRERRSDRIGSI